MASAAAGATARAVKRTAFDIELDWLVGMPAELSQENEPLRITPHLDGYGNIVKIYIWSHKDGALVEPVRTLKRRELLTFREYINNRVLISEIRAQDTDLYNLLFKNEQDKQQQQQQEKNKEEVSIIEKDGVTIIPQLKFAVVPTPPPNDIKTIM